MEQITNFMHFHCLRIEIRVRIKASSNQKAGRWNVLQTKLLGDGERYLHAQKRGHGVKEKPEYRESQIDAQTSRIKAWLPASMWLL